MRRRAALPLIAALFAAIAASSGAQDGGLTLDDPFFGMLQGGEVTHVLDRGLDDYELPIGPFDREGGETLRLEGAVREYAYRRPGGVTTLQALRFHQFQMAARGYDSVFECESKSCGGFDFRFGAYVADAPRMEVDLNDFRFLAARAPDGDAASVLVSRVGGRLTVQIVAVEIAGAPPPPAVTTAPDAAPAIEAPPPAEAEAAALARALREAGRVVLDGIEFETGSATLTPSSVPALAGAARMLARNGEMQVVVVGHTDSVGGLDSNVALSKRRAEAVLEALADLGADRARLAAAGAGYLAPRASNASPEGRMSNRRVELVLER